LGSLFTDKTSLLGKNTYPIKPSPLKISNSNAWFEILVKDRLHQLVKVQLNNIARFLGLACRVKETPGKTMQIVSKPF
jgi:hypothetical protein